MSFKIIIEFTHKAVCLQWLLKDTLWQFLVLSYSNWFIDFIYLLGSIWELFSFLETIQFFVTEFICIKLTKLLSYNSNLWQWLFLSFIFSLSNCLGNALFAYFSVCSVFKEQVFKCIYFFKHFPVFWSINFGFFFFFLVFVFFYLPDNYFEFPFRSFFCSCLVVFRILGYEFSSDL